MTNVLKVKQNELRHNEEGLMYFNEELFTGISQWFWDNGQLGCEMSYQDGILNGWSYSWHRNGQKESETFYKNECVDGTDKEWYENGQMKLDSEIRNGKFVWKKEWDEEGNLITNIQNSQN